MTQLERIMELTKPRAGSCWIRERIYTVFCYRCEIGRYFRGHRDNAVLRGRAKSSP